jgi:hypothetical protein
MCIVAKVSLSIMTAVILLLKMTVIVANENDTNGNAMCTAESNVK